MADKFLKAPDLLSGKDAKIIATIDGRVVELAEVKSYVAKIAKKKKEFNVLGRFASQHKSTGWNGTGTLTFYYVTPTWTRMVIDYAKTGKDLYFDILAINEDPNSTLGRQQMKISECNIDEAEISKIDVDADWLESSFNFTFSDVEPLEEFKQLF